MEVNHIGLFEGIGGFSLAARWMGWKTVAVCEINPFCQKILKRHFPKAQQHGDITTTDFTIYRGQCDILTGGDPCQPHSIAGLGKGKEDDRYLWPEFDRAISEIQPTWVVNENVIGSVSNGILDIKINDLESKGYTCQPVIIPAEAVGALHQRERVWLIAYDADRNTGDRAAREIQAKSIEKELCERYQIQHACEPVDLRNDFAYPYSERFQEQHIAAKPSALSEGLSRYFGFGANAYGNIERNEIESAIVRMLNGIPEGLDYPYRNQRIKALGNAIVPQVAYEIFKAIEQYELQY